MNLGELHRHEYGRVLVSLIRAVKDFDLAEDALQEAFAAALAQWPAQGPPQNPVAWLIATARHKAIDQIRCRALAENKRDDIATLVAEEEDMPVPLDALRLIFTCCHPAVAIAMADGLEHGLALLDTIHLPGYHLLPAARGPVTPPGPSRQSSRSIPASLGAGHQGGRAAISRATADGGHPPDTVTVAVGGDCT